MFKILFLFLLPLAALADDGAVQIGFISPLSGNRSSIGEDARKGAELALEDLGPDLRSGIKLIFEDSQGEPRIGVSAYQKLINQGVKLLITQNSNISMPILPLSKRDAVLQMGISTTSDKYSTPDDFALRTNGSTIYEARVMADFIIARGGKLAVLTMQDEYPATLQKHLLDELHSRGLAPVLSEDFNPQETDFRALIAKIKNSQINTVACLGYQTQCGMLVKQLREANSPATIVANVPVNNKEFFSTAGKAADGVFVVYPLPNYTHPAAAEFESKFGYKVNLFSANAYDAVILLGQALPPCKGSANLPACVSEKILKLGSYHGLSGEKKINPLNGDMNDSYSILVSKSGKFISESFEQNNSPLAPVKIGWIGAMTGSAAKWGVYQAALLGLEDVNAAGGINNRPLEIIFEDSSCNGKSAVTAFKKLSGVDGVKFILGGHCSPDTLAFAPLAEQMKILSIASISSSPKISDQGDYIFRLTPVSTRLADLVGSYAYNKAGIKKLATIYEQTDYVIPVAEKLEQNFKESGGSITSSNAFNPGETDFRSLLIKASRNSEAIYLGIQAPDTGLIIMKQARDLGIKQIIFGNEQFAGALLSSADKSAQALLENIIFAEPVCDLKSASVNDFSEKYKQRYKVEALPFGCYTGESYDSVRLLANAIGNCGENVDCVRDKLYQVHDYAGASGVISINAKGDGEKPYLLKKISGGQIVDLE